MLILDFVAEGKLENFVILGTFVHYFDGVVEKFLRQIHIILVLQNVQSLTKKFNFFAEVNYKIQISFSKETN